MTPSAAIRPLTPQEFVVSDVLHDTWHWIAHGTPDGSDLYADAETIISNVLLRLSTDHPLSRSQTQRARQMAAEALATLAASGLITLNRSYPERPEEWEFTDLGRQAYDTHCQKISCANERAC